MIVEILQSVSFHPIPTELSLDTRQTLVLWPLLQNLFMATFGRIDTEVMSFMLSDQEKEVPVQGEGEVEGEEE